MKKKLLPLLLLCSCLSPLICSAGSEREVTLKGLGQAAVMSFGKGYDNDKVQDTGFCE